MAWRERYWVGVFLSCLWILPAALWYYLDRNTYRETLLDPVSSFPYSHSRDRVAPVVLACWGIALLYWCGEGIAWMLVRLRQRRIGRGPRA